MNAIIHVGPSEHAWNEAADVVGMDPAIGVRGPAAQNAGPVFHTVAPKVIVVVFDRGSVMALLRFDPDRGV